MYNLEGRECYDSDSKYRGKLVGNLMPDRPNPQKGLKQRCADRGTLLV